jgi:hypothetical protein
MDRLMRRDTYRVTVSREEPWWVAVVDGVGATEAKKFSDLEDMVSDLIAVMRDIDKPDFDLVCLPRNRAVGRQARSRLCPKGFTGRNTENPSANLDSRCGTGRPSRRSRRAAGRVK